MILHRGRSRWRESEGTAKGNVTWKGMSREGMVEKGEGTEVKEKDTKATQEKEEEAGTLNHHGEYKNNLT